MSNKYYVPRPVFDTISKVLNQYDVFYADDNPRQGIRRWLSSCFAESNVTVPSYAQRDFQAILNFLYSYRGSTDTFDAYRRDLERLLQWSWFVREQSILKHKREDLESFIEFCRKPYKRWIGLKTVARFKRVDGEAIPNSEWRPFTVHVSKKDHKAGMDPSKDDYQLSQPALKVMFGILSSFYNYLLQEELAQVNPIALMRQKSKYIRTENTSPIVRRLSDRQWETVINLAKLRAKSEEKEERTVFILSCLYSMYLRISELVASDRWTPTMSDFIKDADGNWWFKTVGKGNKARQIAVSDAMLEALVYYRKAYLSLPPYPLMGETTPLVGHINNHNASIKSTRPIRQLVQQCFDQAADKIESSGELHEADSLRLATVHWLRHTGISDDVKIRPREHVRDDAGHSSSAVTDRYIDVELKERARSAKDKPMMVEEHQHSSKKKR
ncbi:MAG: site-specific integrase [Pseudomonadales bacterium]|nr:site-specific integrase [Pseudomonadales bacterium]MBL4867527.1 site-specific integrase [Pseudomonadales bacterium]MBL4867802.1 site-specific integrase [Pseudomonadales bacterium]